MTVRAFVACGCRPRTGHPGTACRALVSHLSCRLKLALPPDKHWNRFQYTGAIAETLDRQSAGGRLNARVRAGCLRLGPSLMQNSFSRPKALCPCGGPLDRNPRRAPQSATRSAALRTVRILFGCKAAKRMARPSVVRIRTQCRQTTVHDFTLQDCHAHCADDADDCLSGRRSPLAWISWRQLIGAL